MVTFSRISGLSETTKIYDCLGQFDRSAKRRSPKARIGQIMGNSGGLVQDRLADAMVVSYDVVRLPQVAAG